MTIAARFQGDVVVTGRLIPQSFTAPADSVGDAAIPALAAIDADKLEHRYACVYSQVATADAAVDRKIVHVVDGDTGTIESFAAGSRVVAGATTTVVVDLLKNGTTVLSGTITLDDTNTNYVLEDAPGFASTALVQGDVLEVRVVSVTGTNEPVGLFARLVVTERVTS